MGRIALALVIVFALVSSAQAATLITTERIYAGPVLVGPESAVAWISGHPRQGLRLRVWHPGEKRPVTLLQSRDEQVVSLDADRSGRLSLGLIRTVPGPSVPEAVGYRFLVGPIDGPLVTRTSCVGRDGCYELYGAQPAGALTQGGTLEVVSDGATLVRRDGAGQELYRHPVLGDGLTTEGPLFTQLVTGEGGIFDQHIEIGDIATGERVATLEDRPGRSLRQWALSPLGIVATITGPDNAFDPFELEWRSLTEPAPHVFASEVSGYGPLVVADHQILAEALQSDGSTRLELIGLDGSRRVLARYPEASWIDEADWDGRRVVWEQDFCGRRLYYARPGTRALRALCD